MARTLRTLRRWLTARGLSAAAGCAPFVPDPAISMLERTLSTVGPFTPLLARQVRRNMQAAGVYTPAALRSYFAQAAHHLSAGLRILRLQRRPSEVARIAREEIELDASVRRLREAVAAGRGVIVASPHVCNYLLTAARLNQEVPIAIYLRWTPDERKQQMKRAWCEAAGIPVIIEPPDAANPTARAARCVEALQNGQALVMTPDIAQKDDDNGVPVRIVGRSALLPAGPPSIAMLADAPMVPLFGSVRNGSRHVMTFEPPIRVRHRSRSEGGRRAALAEAMQTWADAFTAFVRTEPALWYLWADSRWTRVFSGSRRYAWDSPGPPAATERRSGAPAPEPVA